MASRNTIKPIDEAEMMELCLLCIEDGDWNPTYNEKTTNEFTEEELGDICRCVGR